MFKHIGHLYRNLIYKGLIADINILLELMFSYSSIFISQSSSNPNWCWLIRREVIFLKISEQQTFVRYSYSNCHINLKTFFSIRFSKYSCTPTWTSCTKERSYLIRSLSTWQEALWSERKSSDKSETFITYNWALTFSDYLRRRTMS